MQEQDWPAFGAFSYGFSDVRVLTDAFREAGLAAVQWGSELLLDSLKHPDGVARTKGVLDEAGIQVVGLAGYRNLIASDEAARQGHLDLTRR